jgi:hypothetical protein
VVSIPYQHRRPPRSLQSYQSLRSRGSNFPRANSSRPMPAGVNLPVRKKLENIAFDLRVETLLHPQIFCRLFAPVRNDVERDLGALA